MRPKLSKYDLDHCRERVAERYGIYLTDLAWHRTHECLSGQTGPAKKRGMEVIHVGKAKKYGQYKRIVCAWGTFDVVVSSVNRIKTFLPESTFEEKPWMWEKVVS